MSSPGFLAVQIQPGETTNEELFHEWYNTEHGPLRLRLPFITTGDRYQAADEKKPEWYAIYDVTELALLDSRIYSRLREERSVREKNIIKTLDTLDRKIYSVVSVRGEYAGPPAVIVSASFRLNESDLADYDKWYEEEHTDMISKLPGWKRTRRFKMTVGGVQGMPPSGQVECLAIHDFTTMPDFHGPEIKAAQSTPWRAKVHEKFLWSDLRIWSYKLTFDALEEPPSSVLTSDGAELRFQLEGNPADPVVVCVNSIMTSLHIWDDVAKALMTGINGKTFRVLRYNSRGYSQHTERSNPPTFDLLADDLEYLLQRLSLEKVHAVLGVSMGGVTAINFAIRHPDMLENFIACDCNVSSSPANSQAWKERVELARTKGMSELAKVTVERWVTPASHGSENFKKVLQMVEQSNLTGFEQNTWALSDYDVKPHVGKIKTPGLLIVGEGDGKLPEAMQKFEIPNTSLKVIPRAGHLPFLENHEDFVKAIGEFL